MTPQEIVAGQMAVITNSLKKSQSDFGYCIGDNCENDECVCHEDEYGGDIPDDGFEINVKASVIH